MAKMSNLRRTAADVKADKAAAGGGKGEATAYVPPEDDGARFELEHHHLMKMGLGGSLKSGDGVDFTGKGTVEKSETRSLPEGDRHSVTIRFHKGGIDDAGAKDVSRDNTGKSLRSEIEQVHGKSEEGASLKSARSDSKIAEQAGGK